MSVWQFESSGILNILKFEIHWTLYWDIWTGPYTPTNKCSILSLAPRLCIQVSIPRPILTYCKLRVRAWDYPLPLTGFRIRVRDYSLPLTRFRFRDWDESWSEILGVSSPRQETREILCHRLNTFIFTMENLWLDLYRNINHYAKTNFFHTCRKAAIMYLTHMRAYKGLIWSPDIQFEP